MLANIFRSVKLLIVGDGPLSEYVDSTVYRVGLQDKVRRLRKVDHEDMIDIYNVSDIVIAPSYIEPFGRACREALACSNPLITGNG